LEIFALPLGTAGTMHSTELLFTDQPEPEERLDWQTAVTFRIGASAAGFIRDIDLFPHSSSAP
jgi:hypothetical protein